MCKHFNLVDFRSEIIILIRIYLFILCVYTFYLYHIVVKSKEEKINSINYTFKLFNSSQNLFSSLPMGIKRIKGIFLVNKRKLRSSSGKSGWAKINFGLNIFGGKRRKRIENFLALCKRAILL